MANRGVIGRIFAFCSRNAMTLASNSRRSVARGSYSSSIVISMRWPMPSLASASRILQTQAFPRRFPDMALAVAPGASSSCESSPLKASRDRCNPGICSSPSADVPRPQVFSSAFSFCCAHLCNSGAVGWCFAYRFRSILTLVSR